MGRLRIGGYGEEDKDRGVQVRDEETFENERIIQYHCGLESVLEREGGEKAANQL